MQRKRELVAATVGGLVETFDWNVYAILAPFFAATVFGADGPGALIAAYAGFAIGFLARPIGSVLIGRISDTRGRRFGLALSMLVIAGASLAIAVLPGTAAIGVASAL